MPLSIQHQADSAGDKAVSLITDNGGTNVAAAHKGANLATQNGDSVADLVVSLDGETVTLAAQKNEDTAHTGGDPGLMALAVRKDTATALAGADGDYAPLEVDAVGALHTVDRAGYADNATFTRGTSRLVAGLAGIYESTVTALTAGKVALARLTSRGAQVVSSDTLSLGLTVATPAPTGTDIVGYSSAAIVADDLQIRDTTVHAFYIPMENFLHIGIGLKNAATAHDQSLSVSLYSSFRIATSPTTSVAGKIGEFVLPATANMSIAISNVGGVGEGGSAGGATAANSNYYNMPGLVGGKYVLLLLSASVAPTVGSLERIEVVRW